MLIIKINLVHGSVYSNCTDGEVRLFGGRTKYEGTVEVCLNSAWMTISGYSSNYLPIVLCSALGYNFSGKFNTLLLYYFLHYIIDAIYFTGAKGTGAILTPVYCYSHHDSFLDCNFYFSTIQYSSLMHQNDIGVKCEGNSWKY